jgi:hypothetical protein
MKSLFTVVLIALTAAVAAQAPSPLWNSYVAIKDALVNSDAATASVKAGEFIKTADDIKETNLRQKLVENAKSIAATKDIKEQRDQFAKLSQNFYSLVKSVKLSAQPVYQLYCPMKKQSWLSNEKNIRNPYYGTAMLTCGRVTETINP